MEYVAELKYDGVALSLIYKNNKFVKAITRGNGKVGEDVTSAAKRYIINLPNTVNGQSQVQRLIVPRCDFNFPNGYLGCRGYWVVLKSVVSL